MHSNGDAAGLDFLSRFFLKGRKVVTTGARAPYTHTITFADPAPKLPAPRSFTDEDLDRLAWSRCPVCLGGGISDLLDDGGSVACFCSLRQVFRDCLQAYRGCRQIQAMGDSVSPHQRRLNFYRHRECYMADFYLAAKRAIRSQGRRYPELWSLSKSQDWQLFRWYFLSGVKWSVAARVLGVNRAVFYRGVSRVERLVGRELYEVQPYALWPPSHY